MASPIPAVVIAGPTASGKSQLALRLAEAFGGTVINADSMQIYRELRVLSARPSASEMARVPHRLFGLLPASERSSVARWRRLAMAALDEAAAAGRLPIFVGGTGLYVKALMAGLAPIPEIPLAVREQARALHARLGPAAFHEMLGQCDPAAARRLAPGDTQRVIRAWEVLEATGRTLAAWQRGTAAAGIPGARFATILLAPPRSALYDACDARFRDMVGRGAVAEVAALDALGLDPGLPAMKALGVPELRAHLAGESTLEEAIAAGQRATRRYAKRQTTWFRHQFSPNLLLEARYSCELEPACAAFLRRSVLTARN